jgi:hypothetical protein
MTQESPWIYRAGQELPAFAVEWRDRSGALVDFSSGWTFTVKLVNETGAAVLTKTAGITGSATAPNVTVGWAADELNIVPGTYRVHLTARRTADSLDRLFRPGTEPSIVVKASV